MWLGAREGEEKRDWLMEMWNVIGGYEGGGETWHEMIGYYIFTLIHFEVIRNSTNKEECQ